MTLIERVFRRRAAYQACLLYEGKLTRPGEIMLSDLRAFCRARSSTAIVSPRTGQIDPLAMALAEGRREVFNRITQYLSLDDKTIERLREESPDGYERAG